VDMLRHVLGEDLKDGHQKVPLNAAADFEQPRMERTVRASRVEIPPKGARFFKIVGKAWPQVVPGVRESSA